MPPIVAVHQTPSLTQEKYEEVGIQEPPKFYPAHTFIQH